MNPIVLQTLQLMLSMVTSDKEAVTAQMKKDATTVINNLMIPIVKDAMEYREQSSSIQL